MQYHIGVPAACNSTIRCRIQRLLLVGALLIQILFLPIGFPGIQIKCCRKRTILQTLQRVLSQRLPDIVLPHLVIVGLHLIPDLCHLCLCVKVFKCDIQRLSLQIGLIDAQIHIIRTVCFPQGNSSAEAVQGLGTAVFILERQLIAYLQAIFQPGIPLCRHLKAQERLVVISVHAQQPELYRCIGAVKAAVRRCHQGCHLFRMVRRDISCQALKERIQSAITGSCRKHCAASHQDNRSNCPGHPSCPVKFSLRFGRKAAGLALHSFQHSIRLNRLRFQRWHIVFFCVVVIQ